MYLAKAIFLWLPYIQRNINLAEQIMYLGKENLKFNEKQDIHFVKTYLLPNATNTDKWLIIINLIYWHLNFAKHRKIWYDYLESEIQQNL